MYAVGIDSCGLWGLRVPMGNTGIQRLRNKTERGWKSETQTMHKCVDEVWVVTDITQEMCEMNNGKFVDYVLKHGRRIW